MEWVPDADQCPYPGCTKEDSDVEPANRPEHIFQHYKDSMYEQLWQLFGEIHSLSQCPWESCDFKIHVPKVFARRLDEHCSNNDQCRVVDENGACGHSFSVDAQAHLELDHGLVAAADDSEELINYCRICYHWTKGRKAIEDHYIDHLPWIMQNVRKRLRLLGALGTWAVCTCAPSASG